MMASPPVNDGVARLVVDGRTCHAREPMNFNQLRFVQAVAAAGTFTAGAERCYVTQSTLSSGVAQLEGELGERIFVRTTRSVSLTPFGRRLMPFVEEVLNAQANLLQAAESFLDPDAAQVRIGLCPLVDLSRVDQALAPFRKANRSVRVVLEQLSGVNPRLVLEEGRFDFLLGPSEVRVPQLERARLYEDELVYLPSGATAGAPQGEAPVRLQDIAGDTFLLVHDRCGLTVRTRQLFRSRRLPLIPYESHAVSYQVLEEWAGLGVGSAILPRSKVRSPAARPILLGNGQRAMIRFEAVWSPANVAPPHLHALANHLKRASAGLVGSSASSPSG